jgi:hypothetical protein
LRAVSLQETGMMLAPSILKECAEELDAAIDARDPKRTSWYQHEWVTYQVVGFMGGIGDPLLHTDNAPGREPVYVRRAAPPAHTPAPPQTPAAGALCACGQRRPEDCVAATCRYARAFAPPPTAQPPQQWREIGSAPKPEIGEDRVFIVLRDKFGEAHVGFWTGEDWSGPQFGVRDPTHWVPLPETTKETR